jgi:hypothetical protein
MPCVRSTECTRGCVQGGSVRLMRGDGAAAVPIVSYNLKCVLLGASGVGKTRLFESLMGSGGGGEDDGSAGAASPSGGVAAVPLPTAGRIVARSKFFGLPLLAAQATVFDVSGDDRYSGVRLRRRPVHIRLMKRQRRSAIVCRRLCAM